MADSAARFVMKVSLISSASPGPKIILNELSSLICQRMSTASARAVAKIPLRSNRGTSYLLFQQQSFGVFPLNTARHDQ